MLEFAEMDALDRRGDKAAGKLLKQAAKELGLESLETSADDQLALLGTLAGADGQPIPVRLISRGLASVGQRGLLGHTRYRSARVRVVLDRPGLDRPLGSVVMIGKIPGLGDHLTYESASGGTLFGGAHFRREVTRQAEREIERGGQTLSELRGERPEPGRPELEALSAPASSLEAFESPGAIEL